MNKIRRTIKFTGKNLNDVFWLPCVKNVMKVEGEPMLVLWRNMVKDGNVAKIGDVLVEYANGEWEVQ